MARLDDPDSAAHVLAKFGLIAIWPDANPWPADWTCGLLTYADDHKALRTMLAWQAAKRIREGRPMPPPLQSWFNQYVLDGGRVPRRPPFTAERDQVRVAFFKSLGANQATAARIAAEQDGRETKSIEASLYRPAKM